MSNRSELIETIRDIENGLAMNPTGEILERLTSRLARAKSKLAEIEQKKSNQPPTENIGQFREPAMTGYIPTVGRDLPNQAKTQSEKENETPEKIRELSGNYQGETRVIGTVTAAPVITVPVVEIALSSGTKRMNRAEIMTMLKTWFKRVATSKAMEEGRYTDAYAGAMGQDTYKLFEAWNIIYNETKEGSAWPPMLDCFPGYRNASAVQKVNAELLWRWASNDK